jgi:ABC-type polysaccharide transport system permease subunit
MEANAPANPNPPEAAPAKASSRTRSERKLAWMLCAPAVLAMLLVTAYPIAYAVVLSLQDVDLRFPDEGGFVGLSNYTAVLTSDLWWTDLFNTVFIMVVSVAVELVLGMAIAMVMTGRSLAAASSAPRSSSPTGSSPWSPPSPGSSPSRRKPGSSTTCR